MLFVHWCLSTQPILNSTVPWLRTPQDLITSHIVRVVMLNIKTAFRMVQTAFPSMKKIKKTPNVQRIKIVLKM